MKSNCLKLNLDKTEVGIFHKDASLWDSTWWPTNLGPNPSTQARNLGIINNKLYMSAQVNAVTMACFHTLRMLKQIFRWLPNTTRKTVTQAVITIRLDYRHTFYACINN